MVRLGHGDLIADAAGSAGGRTVLGHDGDGAGLFPAVVAGGGEGVGDVQAFTRFQTAEHLGDIRIRLSVGQRVAKRTRHFLAADAGELGRFKAALAHVDGLGLAGGVCELGADGDIRREIAEVRLGQGVFVSVLARQLELAGDGNALAGPGVLIGEGRRHAGKVQGHVVAIRHTHQRASGEGSCRGAVIGLALGGDIGDGDGGDRFTGVAHTDILGVEAAEEAIGHPGLLAVIGHAHRAPEVMAGLGKQRETQIVVVIG